MGHDVKINPEHETRKHHKTIYIQYIFKLKLTRIRLILLVILNKRSPYHNNPLWQPYCGFVFDGPEFQCKPSCFNLYWPLEFFISSPPLSSFLCFPAIRPVYFLIHCSPRPYGLEDDVRQYEQDLAKRLYQSRVRASLGSAATPPTSCSSSSCQPRSALTSQKASWGLSSDAWCHLGCLLTYSKYCLKAYFVLFVWG